MRKVTLGDRSSSQSTSSFWNPRSSGLGAGTGPGPRDWCVAQPELGSSGLGGERSFPLLTALVCYLLLPSGLRTPRAWRNGSYLEVRAKLSLLPVLSLRLLLPAAWVLATRSKSGVFSWRPNPCLTAQLGSNPQLSPATPSRSQSEAQPPGQATPRPPRPRPRHAPYTAPLRALREVAPDSAHHSLMVQSNRTTLSCPLPSSASGPAAWFEAGPIPTHYSLEVRPRTRLAPSALGLQVMRPARDSESLPLQSLSVLPNGLTPCGLPLPSHFPARPPVVFRSPPVHAFASTTFPRGSPLGLQLGAGSPAPPLPGDSPLRPDPVPLSNLAQGCRPGAPTLAF